MYDFFSFFCPYIQYVIYHVQTILHQCTSETNLYQVVKGIEAVISKTSAATAMEDLERLGVGN